MHITRQLFLLALCAPGLLLAQFTTNSTGADGAYSPTVSGDFDPVALGINAAGDNVFNFTTINIPVGVTIKLRASKLRNQAVTWLATGNVTIAGTLDLSGQTPTTINTASAAQVTASRVYPEPGPGGYTGGLGSGGGIAPENGAGPGGGGAGGVGAVNTAIPCLGGAAAYLTIGPNPYGTAKLGTPYGSYLLVPLYGGSGGGGGWGSAAGNIGGIGGAGGGGIRIASNTQISVTGSINAKGGDSGSVGGTNSGCSGGPGSGGAINLIAPTILGAGSLVVNSGVYIGGYQNYNGIIRFSTNTNSFTGNANGGIILGPLYLPPPNSTLTTPNLRITQVNGVNVPINPGGQYLYPDVIVAASGSVPIAIAAANIPLGTVANLRLTSETGPDQLVTCSALAGTIAASTATCTATLPFSVSVGAIRANW